jgi:hypothetical protein
MVEGTTMTFLTEHNLRLKKQLPSLRKRRMSFVLLESASIARKQAIWCNKVQSRILFNQPALNPLE